MTFRFRKRRTKEPWRYLAASNWSEGKHRAAMVLERIDFDFQGVVEGLPPNAVTVKKEVSVDYWFVQPVDANERLIAMRRFAATRNLL